MEWNNNKELFILKVLQRRNEVKTSWLWQININLKA